MPRFNVKERQYFYSHGKKVYLYPSSQKFIAKSYNKETFLQSNDFIKKLKIRPILSDTLNFNFVFKGELEQIERPLFDFQTKDFSVTPMFYFGEPHPKERATIEPSVGIGKNIIIKLRKGTQKELNALLEEYNLKLVRDLKLPNTYLVQYKKDDLQQVFDIPNRLVELGIAEYAHPEFFYAIEPNSPTVAILNDTEVGEQWSLKDTGQFGGALNKDINIETAWQILNDNMPNNNPNIITAVLDDGLIQGHPEFEGRITAGYNAFTDESDVTTTRNPVISSLPNSHIDYHGTALASLIVANMNNATGIAGVSPNSQLMPIKMRHSMSVTSDTQITDSIDKAVEQRAKIINISWSIRTNDDNITIPYLENKINHVMDIHGTVFCCAAGNYVWGIGSRRKKVRFPGSLEKVITVGAYTHQGEWANMQNTRPIKQAKLLQQRFGSCYGSALNICAPGAIITALQPTVAGTQYFYFAGTSAATALVAGAVSLMCSLKPDLTPPAIKRILEDTANPDILHHYNAERVGKGRLDIGQAMKYVVNEYDDPIF